MRACVAVRIVVTGAVAILVEPVVPNFWYIGTYGRVGIVAVEAAVFDAVRTIEVLVEVGTAGTITVDAVVPNIDGARENGRV